jgi:hypothetical protein
VGCPAGLAEPACPLGVALALGDVLSGDLEDEKWMHVLPPLHWLTPSMVAARDVCAPQRLLISTIRISDHRRRLAALSGRIDWAFTVE